MLNKMGSWAIIYMGFQSNLVTKHFFGRNNRNKRILAIGVLIFLVYVLFLRQTGTPCQTSGGKTGVESTKYAIMMDGGSTGSRIHVYEFLYCDNEVMKLKNEIFREVKPGLSEFDAGESAAKSLGPLLDIAAEHIPKEFHSSTPIALKATAGLRLIPEAKADDILKSIAKLFQNYKFKTNKDSVSIIDGKDEAILAWYTVNFLAGKLNQNQETAVTLEMGGGSVQVVAQTEKKGTAEYYETFKHAGRKFDLYRHSYLGYGLMEARKRIVQHFVENHDHSAGFPCYPVGQKVVFASENGDTELVGNEGGWQECKKVIEGILDTDAVCLQEPCSINGIHQPNINNAEKIFVFSFFYDRIHILGFPTASTLEEVEQKLEKLCSINTNTSEIELETLAVRANNFYCLDLGFIYLLLKEGFKIDEKKELQIAKRVEGFEIGWSLGAAIKMLE